MQRQGLLFCICAFIICVAYQMSGDKNAIIRFLGYLIAVVTAVGVLLLVLYFYYDINLLTLFQ